MTAAFAPAFASTCHCARCPGAGCTCGCQPTTLQPVQPAACHCGGRCGCDAGESGCSCKPAASEG